MAKKKKKGQTKKKGESKAPRMSAGEFMAKVFDDKVFRQQVTILCYGYQVEQGEGDALARWLNEGARRMGHSYTDQAFIAAFNEQVSKLGFFKRTYVLGSLMGTMSASRKASQ